MRVVIWAVAVVFGLSLLAAIGLTLYDNRPLDIRRIEGVRYGEVRTALIHRATGHSQVQLAIDRSHRFSMQHPLARLEGIVSIQGSTVTLTIDRIDGKPVQEWSKEWPNRRLELVRKAMHTLPAKPVPALPLSKLSEAKNADEGVKLLKKHFPVDAADPFKSSWKYEVSRHFHWKSLNPGQPNIF